jgi:hypothetical protein
MLTSKNAEEWLNITNIVDCVETCKGKTNCRAASFNVKTNTNMCWLFYQNMYVEYGREEHLMWFKTQGTVC